MGEKEQSPIKFYRKPPRAETGKMRNYPTAFKILYTVFTDTPNMAAIASLL